MTRIIRIAMVVFVAGMLVTQAVYANEKGCWSGDKEGKHGKMFEKMTKDLNLTADQQAKLKANKEAQHEKMKALRDAIKANRAKFKEALARPGATRADLEPVIAEKKSLQSQMIDQRVDGILAVKAILTPEQFNKMQEKFEKRMDERGERGDHAKKWHDDD
jgi:Spy/CpxP family protein refolding chaperone